MAELSKRPWFWFAGTALMLALAQPAAAFTVVGDAPGVFLDPSAIDAAPVRSFAAYDRPALLMPGESRTPPQRIVLTPPGGRRSASGGLLLTPPRGQSSSPRLLVPETRRIVLTPPAGTAVRLTPPSTAKARLTAPGEKRMSARSAAPTPRAPTPRAPAKAAPPKEAPPIPAIEPAMTPPTPPAAEPAPAVRSSLPVSPTEKPVEAVPPAIPSGGEPMPLIPPADAVKVAPPTAVAPVRVAPEVPATPMAEIPAAPRPPRRGAMTTIAVATPSAIPAPPPADAPPATPAAAIALAFDPADARLNETHRALLKSIAARLNEDSDASVQLLAYAQAENRSKARRLSLSRALAVRSYLLSQDVRNTRSEVRALGDQVPSGKPDRVDVVLQHP